MPKVSKIQARIESLDHVRILPIVKDKRSTRGGDTTRGHNEEEENHGKYSQDLGPTC